MSRAGKSEILWEFWIDVGGTFTDCVARRANGGLVVHKVLSSGAYKGLAGDGSDEMCIVDPMRRGDPEGFFDGWRLFVSSEASPVAVERFEARAGRICLAGPLAGGVKPGLAYELRCDEEAPIIAMRWIMGLRLGDGIGRVNMRLGTTRGTNALLERKGAATALVTTRGFGDVLRIGHQARPRLFDLNIRKPEPLYSVVAELEERVDASGRVLKELDEQDVRDKLEGLRADGIESVAICLMNSYRNPRHELVVEKLAWDVGFRNVSLSSRLSPLQRIVPRGETTVVDAYLTPVVRDYLDSIRAAVPQANLKLMTSAGALVSADSFVAKDSILSGPAAGVIAAAHVGRSAGFEKIIGFDMGGTSTDVSRYDGEFERRYEMEIEDRRTGGSVRVMAPMLSIETVAAGGGSICGFDGIKPTVGPQSAGADPGPACYGRGGPLCVTDANLILGRILPEHFPFPLDRRAVERRLDELIAAIKGATGKCYGREALAEGYVSIANAHMAAAITRVTLRRGHDPREHALVSFGGAGGQHACALARELGIRRVVLHPLAGVLSAVGIGLATVSKFAARDVGTALDDATLAAIRGIFAEIEIELRREMLADGVGEEDILPPRTLLDLRYRGQDTAITVGRPADGDWRAEFERAHRRLYGFLLADREIEVVAARVELSTRTEPGAVFELERGNSTRAPEVDRTTHLYSDGAVRAAAVFRRERLCPGDRFVGPAIVSESSGTIVLDAGWMAQVAADGNIVLEDSRPNSSDGRGAASFAVAKTGSPDRDPEACDPITLELFNNHFSAIAEQMGVTLQRTALSTNVKERLDFSCAVFDRDGGLVANAPHIPVHLGAMGQCVKCMIEDMSVDAGHPAFAPGEVYVTNDPYRGGSHLPDVTVISPVFDDAGRDVRFFVASRAHHSEIGGITPGSMPPDSRNLAEEGVLIRAMRLAVTRDDAPLRPIQFRDKELRRILSSGPYPSRAVEQNISDIYAQVAANHRGVELLRELTGRCGLESVQAYMRHMQNAAEAKTRTALRRLPPGRHAFTDHLDDGTPICVAIRISDNGAELDFTGTGPVLPGNLNAVPAIVASAAMYCVRCLIDEDIPLNAGVLKPLTIIVPPSLLNPPHHPDPTRCAAVAGGNVETSQRMVDCIFGALGVAAASQGTMNNFLFGNESLGYYETIGGGSGAGPGFDGADAVHTHMTNTRLTDPEVLEARYPVRLRRFAVRRGSGGAGKHRGGDGIIREIEFLAPLEVSLLTQRRTRAPYGVAGGRPGEMGRNVLIRRGGEAQLLPSLHQFRAEPGDVLVIETPGGGGFGAAT